MAADSSPNCWLPSRVGLGLGEGLAAVVATHDPSLVGLADEVLDLRDGALAMPSG